MIEKMKRKVREGYFHLSTAQESRNQKYPAGNLKIPDKFLIIIA